MVNVVKAPSPEQVKSVIDRVLTIGGFFVKLTPNQTDDQILNMIKMVADQEWFPNLIVTLLDLFDKKQTVDIQKLISELRK